MIMRFAKRTISKTDICSFSVELNTKCDPNRSDHDTVFLRERCSDISNHLQSCHLSRKKMSEVELILARAWLFDLGGSKVKEMNIVPRTEIILAGTGSLHELAGILNMLGISNELMATK